MADLLEEPDPLEQVAEAVGFEHHADEVRLLPFVARDEVRRQRSRREAKPVLQLEQVRASRQQLRLNRLELSLVDIQPLLDRAETRLRRREALVGLMHARRFG